MKRLTIAICVVLLGALTGYASAGDADPRAAETVDAAVTPSPTTSTWATVLGNGNTSGGTDVTISDGDHYTHTSTATSGNEFAITATPGSSRTSQMMVLTGTGSNWGSGAAVLQVDSEIDTDLRPLMIRGLGATRNFFDNSGSLYFGGSTANASIGLTGSVGMAITQRGNLTSGDQFKFTTTAAGELGASSGDQSFIAIDSEIDQSGTAGYNALRMSWTETGTGSGAHRGLYINAPAGFSGDLIKSDVAGVEKFAVSSAGAVGAASFAASGNVIGANVGATAKFFIGNESYGVFRGQVDDGLHITPGYGPSGTNNNHIIYTTYDNVAKDHDRDSLSSTVTSYWFSDEDPDVSNQEWGSITHDGTDFVFSTGAQTGVGSGPTTINNGISLRPGAITSSTTADTGVDILQELNDSTAAGGSDHMDVFKVDTINTDVTGWDSINLASFQYGGSEKAKITNGGGVRPGVYTGDPCATEPEGALWYNDTADVFCFCNGAGADLKVADNSACF